MGGWGGVGGVVAHKTLVSAPVPLIGDLGIEDWGLDWGLTIKDLDLGLTQ